MKKMVIAAAVAAMAAGGAVALRTIVSQSDPIFEANVEALTQAELYGFCSEQSGECLGRCPSCGSLIYAPDHKGPSYNISGSCPNCSK